MKAVAHVGSNTSSSDVFLWRLLIATDVLHARIDGLSVLKLPYFVHRAIFWWHIHLYTMNGGQRPRF